MILINVRTLRPSFKVGNPTVFCEREGGGEGEVMLINRFGHWGLLPLIKESPQ